MELLIFGLIIFGLYLFIRTISRFGVWMTGARFRAYRQLANRYHGRYESRGLADPPTVSFVHNGSQVRVGLAPTLTGQADQNPRTRVVTRFAKGIPFRLELAPAERPAPLQLPKGTRPVTLSSLEFDGQFSIQANDAEMAREFLAAPIRRSIFDLQQIVHAGGMLLSINPERMLLQIDRNLGHHSETLAWAVHHALVIHDGLLEGVHRQWNRGIDIVDQVADQDVSPSESPTCKVCGETITVGSVITCAACLTPHHRDCWEYVGACSIYGCNGKVGKAH